MKWITLVLLLFLVAFYSCEILTPQQPIPQDAIDEADSLMMLIDTTRA